MDDKRHRELRRSSRLFFGSVTAAQTHEITNVLNIINEYSGLLCDLIAPAEQGRAANLVRIRQLAEKIGAQVMRGDGLCRNLNQFAHGVDGVAGLIDLRDVFAQVAAIAERPARLKQVELQVEEPSESIVIEADFFDVQHVMYACLDLALDAATERRRVGTTCSSSDQGAEFCVTSADPIALTNPLRERLRRIEHQLDDLGGRMLVVPDGGLERRVVCVLPSPPPQGA